MHGSDRKFNLGTVWERPFNKPFHRRSGLCIKIILSFRNSSLSKVKRAIVSEILIAQRSTLNYLNDKPAATITSKLVKLKPVKR